MSPLPRCLPFRCTTAKLRRGRQQRHPGQQRQRADHPPAPFPAPLAGQPLSVLDPLRDRITCLCAQGGHAGHPQVSLPGAAVDGLPVGLSIIGPRGSDATLVAMAKAMETTT